MGYGMKDTGNIIAGMIFGAFIMWIVWMNWPKETINEQAIKDEADRRVKANMDSIRAMPMDSVISWIMRD